MSQPENDGFARIVLTEGFCTREQVDRCLRIQSETSEGLSLGQSLLREGFITSEQHSRILDLLRKSNKKDRDTAVVRKAAPNDREKALQAQEDRVLGALAVREGWITAGQLKECQGPGLAEKLVARGFLERTKVEALRARLVRDVLSCPSCGTTLSVVGLPSETPRRCPRCGGTFTSDFRG